MTRQRKWQIEKKENGLCITCAKPAVTATHCLEHAVKARERQHARLGYTRRNNSLSYRLEKGVA